MVVIYLYLFVGNQSSFSSQNMSFSIKIWNEDVFIQLLCSCRIYFGTLSQRRKGFVRKLDFDPKIKNGLGFYILVLAAPWCIRVASATKGDFIRIWSSAVYTEGPSVAAWESALHTVVVYQCMFWRTLAKLCILG